MARLCQLNDLVWLLWGG